MTLAEVITALPHASEHTSEHSRVSDVGIKRTTFTMVLKLYKLDASPPARACMMVCELFNVPVEHIDINLFEYEHINPDFIKINPTHTIPVLEDGDLKLHDSHAIIEYLADVYGKQDSFYPKDVKQRALVNQKLFFNNSILFPRLRNITYPLFAEGVTTVTEKQYNAIDEAYGFLEEFLTRAKYIAGNNITIADIAAYATISSLNIILKINGQKYPKIQAWCKEMEQQPYVQKYNTGGLKKFKELIESLGLITSK